MKVCEFDVRPFNGIDLPMLPRVGSDAPEALIVSSAYADIFIRARGVPSDADMAAAFKSLGGVLADIGDFDVDDVDECRTDALAATLGRWHDTVWYPKSDAICEAWSREGGGRKVPRGPEGRDTTFGKAILSFLETLPRMLQARGVETLESAETARIAALLVGKTMRDVCSDSALTAAINFPGAGALAPESAAELVARFDAGNPSRGPGP